MLTLAAVAPGVILDGYLRYIAYTLYSGSETPMSYSDWVEYAICNNDTTVVRVEEGKDVYYPDTNSWELPNALYKPVVLSCSDEMQPLEAPLTMESTLTNQTVYKLRYKNTFTAAIPNPDITYQGQTKPLFDWGLSLGVSPRHMRTRYISYIKKSDTLEWLLRPRYQHNADA